MPGIDYTKMKIIKMGRFLNMFGMIGITLAPFGIYIKEGYFTERVINHEKIHWSQQLELLIIPFYLLYFLEWLVKIFIYGKRAYMNLSFEREAYDNLGYERKHFDWVKRITR